MTPSRSAVIRGTVLTGGGEPLRGARVYFVRGPVPLPDIAALTAQDGSFVLSAPAAGEYQIGAAADGFAPSAVSVRVTEADSANVTLRLDAQ
jgi:Carboxypeptidase regulatory-like domain